MFSLSQKLHRNLIILLLLTLQIRFTTSRILQLQSSLNEEEEPIQIEPRAYEQWDRTAVPFPCVPENTSNNKEHEGIFYIKLPKTSSTTLSKITTRIAVRESKRQNLPDKCQLHDPTKHERAVKLDIKNRDALRSFAWSLMRHPSDRMISHYGMRASRGEFSTNDFIHTVDYAKPPPRNLQLHFLSPDETVHRMSEAEIRQHVQRTIDSYNFIGIYERLHESLVVLSMLIGVEVNDVIYDFLPSSMSRCGALEQPSWVTNEIREYLDGNSWKQAQRGDFLLFDYVNQSLDLTIEKLGRENVQKKLEVFNKLIEIGTNYAQKQKNLKGCGVLLLFPEVRPWDDIDQLSWFSELSPEDQQFVRDHSPHPQPL